jgi:hypothetical protein
MIFATSTTCILTQNALDLDQEAMEIALALTTEQSFEDARRVYTEGGNSKSIAQVTLSTALQTSLPIDTPISGINADGDEVAGKVYEETSAGATVLEIQYQTSDIQATHVGCRVGGNPEPLTEGCYAASGNLTIEGVGPVQYTYDPLVDNVNGRTLQGFSLQAEEKMYLCDACPYRTYEKFYNYYGSHSYADDWVLAAFAGTSTSFQNGNADFSAYDREGKTEAIKKGTAYMHVWMYTIREMEDAMDDCEQGCTLANCNDDPVHAWDEAVAFYTGSLEGVDGSGSGKFLHELADKRCANFQTCGEFANEIDGTSHVNINIFSEFKLGQNKLLRGECSAAREQKEKIETMMAIPLIQGALRYAYITDNDNTAGEKAEAEGASFAAAVLPLVHYCSAEAAKTIYDNLKVGQGLSANFASVKSAFESTYQCLGVRCEDVGGLYDTSTGTYYTGAEPCGSTSSSSANVGLIVGLSVGGVVFLALVYFVSKRRAAGSSAAKAAAKADTAEQSEVM